MELIYRSYQMNKRQKPSQDFSHELNLDQCLMILECHLKAQVSTILSGANRWAFNLSGLQLIPKALIIERVMRSLECNSGYTWYIMSHAAPICSDPRE